jgi:hypothetical protein
MLSGRHWGGQRNQLCQLSEVLDYSSEEELVLSTGQTSPPEPVQAARGTLAATMKNCCSVFVRRL